MNTFFLVFVLNTTEKIFLRSLKQVVFLKRMLRQRFVYLTIETRWQNPFLMTNVISDFGCTNLQKNLANCLIVR